MLSGHHRKRAAEKAGLEKIWAWVEELDDEAALMELVLSNRQGELSPLEIGLHVLKAVPAEQGKKGKGLESYAKAIGVDRSHVSRLRDAGRVWSDVCDFVTQLTKSGKLKPEAVAKIGEKSQHLAAIHRADDCHWPTLVRYMLDKEWSAADTAHWTGKVLLVGDHCRALCVNSGSITPSSPACFPSRTRTEWRKTPGSKTVTCTFLAQTSTRPAYINCRMPASLRARPIRKTSSCVPSSTQTQTVFSPGTARKAASPWRKLARTVSVWRGC